MVMTKAAHSAALVMTTRFSLLPTQVASSDFADLRYLLTAPSASDIQMKGHHPAAYACFCCINSGGMYTRQSFRHPSCHCLSPLSGHQCVSLYGLVLLTSEPSASLFWGGLSTRIDGALMLSLASVLIRAASVPLTYLVNGIRDKFKNKW